MALRFNWMTGKWDFTSGPAGSGGAPVDATYITVINDPTLTNERALASGNGIVLQDNGPNSTMVINVSDLYDPLLTMGG
jgi:hypothetical protein